MFYVLKCLIKNVLKCIYNNSSDNINTNIKSKIHKYSNISKEKYLFIIKIEILKFIFKIFHLQTYIIIICI